MLHLYDVDSPKTLPLNPPLSRSISVKASPTPLAQHLANMLQQKTRSSLLLLCPIK